VLPLFRQRDKRQAKPVAQRCAKENVDHLGYLLQLSELELIERARRAAERRLKAARFPATKTLEEFDFAARPSINKPLLVDLIRGEYMDKRENILFVGGSGTGKTHIAIALGIASCQQGKKVRFFRVTELITLLLEAKEERQLQRMRTFLGKLDLLILDELGYVPASKSGAELLFDVISTAYERHSVIITTNLPFENWTEVLGSERLTGAALDRLTHRCHILESKGESYRLQDAKRRRRPASKD
jgi:DNA replication protein DnaC